VEKCRDRDWRQRYCNKSKFPLPPCPKKKNQELKRRTKKIETFFKKTKGCSNLVAPDT